MKTKIYGYFDDLIEIEGAINEEANHYDTKMVTITASDGTKAKITYNGIWQISVDFMGSKFIELVTSVGDDANHILENAVGCPSYSDVLVFDEGIEWVKIGRKTFRP